MTLLLACAVCVAAGTFGSMVGIGGGLIIIPVLSQVLGYDIKLTIAASLIGVIAGSISASPRFLAAGIADRRLAVTLLVATVAGGLTGGLTGSFLDERTLAFLLATLLVLVAIQMAFVLRRSRAHASKQAAEEPSTAVRTRADRPTGRMAAFDTHYVEPRTGQEVPYRVERLGPALGVSFVAGNVSGLLGVGGGVINVPTMTSIMGVPLRVATTTSTLMLGATAMSSALVNAAGGRLDPLLAAPVVVGVLVGSRLGARVSLAVSQDVLRAVFVIVALVFAVQTYGRLL
ncbi:MAG: sulfite exporter TauE/SafE family protein [Chloroflexi bacterium]|nr:sulfite exporter TauE/SafE family protein [Chloroflexota bacterium]